VKLFEKGCNSGDAVGCRELGRNTQDDGKAAKLYAQACDGGDMTGCALIGAAYLEGKGVTADPNKAAELYRRACFGGHVESCAIGGELYETGRGGGKNPIQASSLYRHGCFRGSASACVNLARLDFEQQPNEAKRHFESACNFKRDTVACAVVKLAFGGKMPVFAKPDEMNTLLRGCNAGSSRDCATYGTVQAAAANPGVGKPYLQRACISGDKFACAIMKKL
jgi:TPR repeat protein